MRATNRPPPSRAHPRRIAAAASYRSLDFPPTALGSLRRGGGGTEIPVIESRSSNHSAKRCTDRWSGNVAALRARREGIAFRRPCRGPPNCLRCLPASTTSDSRTDRLRSCLISANPIPIPLLCASLMQIRCLPRSKCVPCAGSAQLQQAADQPLTDRTVPICQLKVDFKPLVS